MPLVGRSLKRVSITPIGKHNWNHRIPEIKLILINWITFWKWKKIMRKNRLLKHQNDCPGKFISDHRILSVERLFVIERGEFRTKRPVSKGSILNHKINFWLQRVNFRSGILGRILSSYFSCADFLREISKNICNCVGNTYMRGCLLTKIRDISNFSAKSIRKKFIMWYHMRESHILVHLRSSQNWVSMH